MDSAEMIVHIEIAETLTPDWYVRLLGDQFDLDEWCFQLKHPFDPEAIRLPNGNTVLRSTEFKGLLDAREVRERAQVLINRLNGALLLSHGTRPVRLEGVLRVASDGKFHWIMYAEGAAYAIARARANATLIRADGTVVPPPPPAKSDAQLWNDLAQSSDLISDMLDHFGRADNWYDIYKTLEFCALIAGPKRKLSKLLGDRANAIEAMRRSANFYRHARERRPAHLHTLEEAKPLLAEAVRVTLAKAMYSRP